MKKYLLPIGVMLAVFILPSCKKADPHADLKTTIKTTYADIVAANYEDAYDEAVDLQTAINTFIATPTQVNFDAAKQAWLDAREPYGQTEAFRFAGGPIDDADGPEGLINAWPLDEAYVDYVQGNATSGIINDTVGFPTITKAALEAANEQGGETNISVGFHAIEFLLWGQDLTAPSAMQPGQRPYTDFVNGGTASNQSRRRDYLVACADLLVENLLDIKNEWSASQTGNFRATFLAMENDAAIKHILTGIGVLSKSELAGERIFTALDNHSQEDEHSCFSDNTNRDIRLNTLGVKNVYTGSYTKVNGQAVTGSSLKDLVNKVDASLGMAVEAQLTDAVTKVNATGEPFDNAIDGGETTIEGQKVLAAVNALRALGDKFAEAGEKLGLEIKTELP